MASDFLIDGLPPTDDDLRYVALVNYGAYTSFRIEDGGVRGLDLHLARLEASAVELFGEPLSGDSLRGLIRTAVADRRDAWIRVSLFAPEIVPRSPSATARTVPSPPAASTTSTPSSTAVRACPAPGSSTVVSIHSDSAQPCSDSAAATAVRRASPSILIGL